MFLCNNFNFYTTEIFSGKYEIGDGKTRERGMEKTPEECVETFTMVLKNKDITKNTFLRNAGF